MNVHNVSNEQDILLLYYFDTLTSGQSPNACRVSIYRDKEVYLLDILHHWAQAKCLPAGIRYKYYAIIPDQEQDQEKATETIYLDSPAAVVPVFNNTATILLVQAGAIPCIPTAQVGHFFDLSRMSIYSSHTLQQIEERSTFYRTYDSNKQKSTEKTLSSSLTEILPQRHFFKVRSLNSQIYINNNKHNGHGNNNSNSQDNASSNINSNEGIKASGAKMISKLTSFSSNLPGVVPKRESDESETRKGYEGRTENVERNWNRSHLSAPQSTSTASTLTASVEGGLQAARSFGASLFGFAASVANSVAGAGVNAFSGGNRTEKLDRMKVQVGRIIAEGGFGTVYVATDAESNKKYALKQMICQTKEQLNDAQGELRALRQFRGVEEIIDLVDSSIQSSASHASGTKVVFMLFPLCVEGTIWDMIEHAGGSEQQLHSGPWPFDEHHALQLVMGIARGLQAMHDVGLAHRDVKPHNVLLRNGHPVIMDLGSVTTARISVNSRGQALDVEEEAASKTSAAYRAPELTQTPSRIAIDERVDIWGLGCTMFCIAFGRSPFETPKEGLLRLAILNGNYHPPAGNRMHQSTFSAAFMDLISQMLQVDHTTRPFAGDVVNICKDFL